MRLCSTEPDRDIDHARLFPQSSIRAGFPLHLDCHPDYESPVPQEHGHDDGFGERVLFGVVRELKDGYLLSIG